MKKTLQTIILISKLVLCTVLISCYITCICFSIWVYIYIYIYIYVYVYVYIYLYVYVYVYSCTWAHDVWLHIAATNEPKGKSAQQAKHSVCLSTLCVKGHL